MTAYPFFRDTDGSHIGFDRGNMLDHPPSAIVGNSLVLKFGLDPVYSFGDIAIFINQSINQFICTVTRIYTIKRVQAGQQGHISGTNRCPI